METRTVAFQTGFFGASAVTAEDKGLRSEWPLVLSFFNSDGFSCIYFIHWSFV